jgi:hypothetical protein
MDATVDAPIAGAARAAMPLPLGDFSPERWAIELFWWVGPPLLLAGAAHVVIKWWRWHGVWPLLLSLPIQPWPDFRKWDDRTEFALYEAAALWFDTEPRVPMWWRARRKFRLWNLMITEAAISEDPKSLHGASEKGAPTMSSVTPHTRVHREALKMLAEKEGSRPLFLFPERRGGP